MRALLVLLVVLAACHKADIQKCDLGCRNYFKLHYWKDADQQIEQAPPEERDALRAQKQSDFDQRLLQNLDLCVNKCESGADSHRVQCWIDATTAEEAEKCSNDD